MRGGLNYGYQAIIVLHSKSNSTDFIHGRGQTCNIFALNIPVYPIPSCFKCFINSIKLKQLSKYIQNCSCGSLLPDVLNCLLTTNFLNIVVLKVVTSGFQNLRGQCFQISVNYFGSPTAFVFHSSQRVFICPPFQIIPPPFFDSHPLKKSLISLPNIIPPPSQYYSSKP